MDIQAIAAKWKVSSVTAAGIVADAAQATVEPLTDEQIVAIWETKVGSLSSRQEEINARIFARALLATPPASKATCLHEETHCAGAIWEICDQRGAKWADDEGGKPVATGKADTGEASNRIIRTTWNAAMEEAAIAGGRAAEQCKMAPMDYVLLKLSAP